ncbi:Carboxylic ester hydrolase [Mycena indigotica]|uniref:Carboxylic ester hydrolase n=1 Tax=Mycena indigotica TaxID=2126181 RepID=A0A8H6T6Y2_9AGAR|nr:Carboxylic ester hydrolase [Mycena indigotica]KAF7311914.1 Carboxylic ester hydrolase [Mycena indigotica]
MGLFKLSFLAAVLLNSAFGAPSAPMVDLGYAKYQGSVDPATNITSFLGVRYAASPTGNGRFRAPKAPASVSGVQQATMQPPRCWQIEVAGLLSTNPFRENQTTSSSNPSQLSATPSQRSLEHLHKRGATNVSDEDCLFLSVYYPSNSVGTTPYKLPVVVWIHGGGYLAGSSSQFRGSDLIEESDEDIVVVVIQYRLALLGFLAGTEVKANGNLNVALLDQQFALRWVQKYISQFGGDPDHVTIWGESAGGGAILQQVIANGGKTNPPLFKYAIASSPFTPSQYRYDEHIPQFIYDSVVSQANCTNANDTLECLRQVPATVLHTIDVELNAYTFPGVYAFGPVVEGPGPDSLIQEGPIQALNAGKVNGKSLLTVATAFEGWLFVNTSFPVATSVSRYAFQVFPNLPLEYGPRIESLYAHVGSTADKIIALYGETVFDCPAYGLAQAFPGSAYRGVFAIPPGHHGTDLQYYFPSLVVDVPVLNYPEFFNNTVFIDAFAKGFTAYVSSGNPNNAVSTVTPHWRKWSTRSPIEMVFNRTDGPVSGQRPFIHARETDKQVLERCRFWASVGAYIGQ